MEQPSIAEAGRLLRAGQTTSEALTRAALAQIARHDPALNAFITLTESRALADARRADAELKAGTDRGPLHGIPYALKDIYDTAGIRTTCHSKLRVDVVPEADSAVAAQLAQAGGVLLGKLATHEFAIGGPSFDLPFPPARNPWNRDHVPSGSSSGSAVAVASGMVRMAMGSDTGGSIRAPAAYCGTVGLKPSYGRVSRRGVFPLSTTLDHCGPLTRSVEDAAITLQVIAGHDPLDAASADVPVADYLSGLQRGVAGLRIGIPRAFFANAQAVTQEVLDGIDRTANALRDAGATVEDVTLPDFSVFSACGRVIMLSEAFAIHEADMQSRPQDFGAVAFLRFILGATVTGADVIQALRLRRELTDAVNATLDRYDALITASGLAPAPRFDAPAEASAAASPLQTIPFNVTGHPALSVPVGLTASGLPIGLQVVGRPFDEATTLRIGRAVERLTGWEDIALPM
ncbi:amidase [Limobrevibacterium gyesilva]|uniref:Amidase n=1 Tax=Limobrevibacterium gyesilva TaxID=2991712 RepID=A0AA41YM89_9PROT|nr:amidase [Limobrevibacterium gyesilva]MCW3475320.1 amidase [Limobrevibacterium gyesilva]